MASGGGKLPDKAEAAVEDYSEVVRLMEEDPESSEGPPRAVGVGMEWGPWGGNFLLIERKGVEMEDLNGRDVMKGKIAC